MNSADFLFLFVTTRRPDVSYKRSRLKFITLSLSTFVKATLRGRNAVSFCAHVNVIHSFIQTATGPVACTRPGCCLTIYGMVGVDNPGQLLLRVFTVALLPANHTVQHKIRSTCEDQHTLCSHSFRISFRGLAAVCIAQAREDKKLSYRRGTARCVVSVEILPIATQQCRNYLYDKS